MKPKEKRRLPRGAQGAEAETKLLSNVEDAKSQVKDDVPRLSQSNDSLFIEGDAPNKDLSRIVTVDFSGRTGEEMWHQLVLGVHGYVSDDAFRWLSRIQYRGRDLISESMTLAMPSGLDEKSMSQLLGLLTDEAVNRNFPVSHFVVRELEQITAKSADIEWEDRWHIESGKLTVLGADDEPEWTIVDMLAERSGLLLSGLPHSTKSLLMLLAALECVTSRRVWGKFRVPEKVRNVVFVETEDSPALVKRRLRAFCKGLNIDYPPPGFHLVTPGPFRLVEEGEQALQEIIEKTEADLLVLSTLQGLISGADWKEQKDMAPINAIAVQLQKRCSLVLITHSPWNEKRAAGSVTQAANFSALMHFEKASTEEGTTVKVTLDSKESENERMFRLKLNTEQVQWGERSTTQVRGVTYMGRAEQIEQQQEIDDKKKQWAIGLRRDGESVRDIAKITGTPKSTVQRWLKESNI